MAEGDLLVLKSCWSKGDLPFVASFLLHFPLVLGSLVVVHWFVHLVDSNPVLLLRLRATRAHECWNGAVVLTTHLVSP